MKLAVIGSRQFTDYAFLVGTLDGLQLAGLLPAITAIISGGARGTDTLAARYARERGLPLEEFLPDYPTCGRKAPLVRNQLLIAASHAVVAFHDGTSRGTRHALGLARRQGLAPVLVVHTPNADASPT